MRCSLNALVCGEIDAGEKAVALIVMSLWRVMLGRVEPVFSDGTLNGANQQVFEFLKSDSC
jgi:hypothetical protein